MSHQIIQGNNYNKSSLYPNIENLAQNSSEIKHYGTESQDSNTSSSNSLSSYKGYSEYSKFNNNRTCQIRNGQNVKSPNLETISHNNRIRNDFSNHNLMENEEIIQIDREKSYLKIKFAENHINTVKRLGKETDTTFLLPNFESINPIELRNQIEKNMLEMSHLTSLEQSNRLNWWIKAGLNLQRLLPYNTTGDGNCLLHASSLAMWGIQDRNLVLRDSLHDFISSKSNSSSFYRRWRWQTQEENSKVGFELDEEQWTREWKGMLQLSNSLPKYREQKSGQSNIRVSPQYKGSDSKSRSSPIYDSLEQIHVFALAHVICRPIIVIADRMLLDMHGEPFQPIHFGGIYLPLEINPDCCHKSPLLLAYKDAHFSALLPSTDKNTKDIENIGVPIVDPNTFELLPIHYMIDPNLDINGNKNKNKNSLASSMVDMSDFKRDLINKYLDCYDVHCGFIKSTPVNVNDTPKTIITNDKYLQSTDNLNSNSKKSHTHSKIKIFTSIKKKFTSSNDNSSSNSNLSTGVVANESNSSDFSIIDDNTSNSSIINSQSSGSLSTSASVGSTQNWNIVKNNSEIKNKIPIAKLKVILPDNYEDTIDNYIKTETNEFYKHYPGSSGNQYCQNHKIYNIHYNNNINNQQHQQERQYYHCPIHHHLPNYAQYNQPNSNQTVRRELTTVSNSERFSPSDYDRNSSVNLYKNENHNLNNDPTQPRNTISQDTQKFSEKSFYSVKTSSSGFQPSMEYASSVHKNNSYSNVFIPAQNSIYKTSPNSTSSTRFMDDRSSGMKNFPNYPITGSIS